MIDYDYWNALSAQERIAHWDATGQLLKAPGKILLSEVSQFILNEHFHDAQNNFCGSCEEPQPQVMCWTFSDDEDLADHKNPIMAKVVENLNIEYSICSWCVEEEVTRRICVHCKKPGWHKCLEGFEHQLEQNTFYDELLCLSRKKILEEIERFSGMPTLEYDEILESLHDLLIIAEKQLMVTCEGCGGEIIPAELENETLHFIPENGWCAMELPECEVVA